MLDLTSNDSILTLRVGGSSFLSKKNILTIVGLVINSDADKGPSTVNYRQSSPFDRPYLSLMIFMKGGFSRKWFFLLISLLFLGRYFEQF